MPSKALKYFKKKLTKLRKNARLQGQDCDLDLTSLDAGEQEAYCGNEEKRKQAILKQVEDWFADTLKGFKSQYPENVKIIKIKLPPIAPNIRVITWPANPARIWVDDPEKSLDTNKGKS